MSLSEDDNRLIDILDMIGNMAALDFSKVLITSEQNDMLDAIALGLNMLSEELNSQVVAKVKLNEVNKKLEKFAYTTAHDLKSPINAQSSLIYLLQLAIEDKNLDDIVVYSDKLKQVNSDMEKLVQGILEYSVKTNKDVGSVIINFNELLNEVIELDRANLKANITIISQLPTLPFNRTVGIQIFRNLIDNAIKYCDKEICEISIDTNEFDDYHEISVEDNGPGIAHDYQQSIFELFNKVDPILSNGASAGIGLSTVKSLIEAIGGSIRVESQLAKGAKFTLTVPKTPNYEE